MASIAVLADALYSEEITRARVMRPEDKLLEGPRLFDRACRLMADGIRHHHPTLSEAEVRGLFAIRFARVLTLEGR